MRTKRIWLGVLCAGLCSLALVPVAQGAPSDPLFVYVPNTPGPPPSPPPTGYLEGPCGLGVDSTGRFYVSDYYHHAVDVFGSAPTYQGQLAGEDPLDGPCALAFDATDHLYLNNFHRGVVRYGAFGSFGSGTTIAGAGVDEAQPTGVAVDPTTGYTYVDDRTYVAVYEASGAPLEEGGEPVRIGEGTLGEGFGLALSRYGPTAGYLYVPDAQTKTVKVYDPATSKTTPVASIHGPGAGFTSLRDAAVAVDWTTGAVYVVDDLQPSFTEEPQAVTDVFSSAGSYLGVLKYKILDALPPGLAVDNSPTSTQGRVYLTSGNTDQAGVYAYGPGAQTPSASPPAVGFTVKSIGSGEGKVKSDLGGLDCAGTCEAQIRSGANVTLTATPEPGSEFAGFSGGGCSGSSPTCTVAADEAQTVSAEFRPTPPAEGARPGGEAGASGIVQEGNLRLSLEGKLSPKRLPRKGQAPIAVTVGWGISTTDESPVPTLKKLGIEINRKGSFDATGLPVCPIAKIQPASTQRALANCRSSLVGQGSFSADVALREQEAYETTGRLLVFNGERHHKPVLLGQIYAPHPFATSFVIPFEVKKISKGSYGTALEATLPKAIAAWGNLTGIKMTLSRRYSYQGKRRSYVSGGCPAPKGFSKALFPLARASFAFKGGTELDSTLTGTCRAKG
jgi:hypothetical protein